MVPVDLTLYSVLRVSRHATDAQIRGAYRLRALATHPDKGGNEEEFLKANCRPWSGSGRSLWGNWRPQKKGGIEPM